MNIEPLELIFELADDGRVSEAVHVLDTIIAQEPEIASLYALRAFLLLSAERTSEASASAQRALEIDPDHPYVQHAAGEVALALKEPASAIAAAQRARAIDPENDEFIFLEARARALLGQWDEVRARMDYILAGNPDHENAALLRAYALEAKQGDRGPLGAADWQDLAQRFPLNAFARTGHGWRMLQQGSAHAKEEFEQALAVDPNSQWAKEGLVLALKARYPGYGLLLRFFFWLNRLPSRTQTMIAIGGVVGYNMLRNVARQNPEVRPFVMPLIVAYVVFFLTSWLADPLLSLMLMRHPEARRVLSEDDKRSGMSVGACLGAAAILALIGMLTPWKAALPAAMAIGFASLTVAGAYNSAPGRYRTRLVRAAMAFVAMALLSTVVPDSLSNTLLLITYLGIAIGTWVSRSWAQRSWSEHRQFA